MWFWDRVVIWWEQSAGGSTAAASSIDDWVVDVLKGRVGEGGDELEAGESLEALVSTMHVAETNENTSL
ncbi:hypothetical protein F0562_019620 [Nyssa sinensis]|uniref:Uncharacterized protein n=1 Tax=Nyssa sinensis TaxID=561372 RepID=A0A5J5BQ74_9ASTE|nr:hypothetical protein F0562_019620 [Nyssa sinensis]